MLFRKLKTRITRSLFRQLFAKQLVLKGGNTLVFGIKGELWDRM